MAEQKTFGIRGSYNPSDEERDTVKFIYADRYEKMKTSKDRLDAVKFWDKAEKQYEMWREDRKGWQSNHVVPMTFSVIETALAEIAPQNLRPVILPRGKEDEAKATIMKYIWDYCWEVSDGDINFFNILKDALMFGTGIGQEYYWEDKRIVNNTTLDKNNKEIVGQKETTVYDDCYLEAVKLQDFFVDETARGFNGSFGARDCIRRYIMDIDDFKLFFQGKTWDSLNNAKYVLAGGDTNYYEFYKPPQGIDTSKQVEVLWYWAQKPKDRLVIVANDVLIKDGANPYKHKRLPFARAVDVKRQHRFYGKGEAEILESMHDEQTTLRRMMIDRNHLDIDKMFFVSRNLSLNDEDLVARPHGMIPTDDVNGSKAVEYGDTPRSTELGLKYLEDDSVIATGINPRQEALPQVTTATQAAIMKESALKRINLKIWMMKKEFLIDFARLRCSNILQYYPQPKLEKIVGEENEQMYKDNIAELTARGLITQDSKGQKYVKQYRTIRLQDQQMNIGDTGQPEISPSQGFSFFELKPEYYVPSARGGFDIKFDASANIDISKPLMQDKELQLFDRLSQIALNVPGSYDIVKLADGVIKSYDKNPADYKVDTNTQNDGNAFLQNQISLASMENQQMIQGTKVPATPYASAVHTRVHVEFMQSPPFQQSKDPNIDKIFSDHVTGEIMAQQMRGQNAGAQTPPPGATPQPQQPGQPDPNAKPAANISVSVKADAMTAEGQQILKDVGIDPGNVPPQAPQGGQGGTFNGTVNKGVAAPDTTMRNIIPNLGGKQ
jgi:hypothetical protein